MFWYIFSSLITTAAIALVVYIYIKDRRYEQSKVSHTMSPEVWQELDQELKESRDRQAKFQKELEKAQKKE